MRKILCTLTIMIRSLAQKLCLTWPTCQPMYDLFSNQTGTETSIQLTIWEIECSRSWCLVCVDDLRPTLNSTYGYMFILSVQHYFSKFCLLCPVRLATVKKIPNFTEDNDFVLFDVPKDLSDNGKPSVSEEFKNLWATYKLSVVYALVYHPLLNVVERMYRVLKTMRLMENITIGHGRSTCRTSGALSVPLSTKRQAWSHASGGTFLQSLKTAAAQFKDYCFGFFVNLPNIAVGFASLLILDRRTLCLGSHQITIVEELCYVVAFLNNTLVFYVYCETIRICNELPSCTALVLLVLKYILIYLTPCFF